MTADDRAVREQRGGRSQRTGPTASESDADTTNDSPDEAGGPTTIPQVTSQKKGENEVREKLLCSGFGHCRRPQFFRRRGRVSFGTKTENASAASQPLPGKGLGLIN